MFSFYDVNMAHEIEEFTLYSVYTNLSITVTDPRVPIYFFLIHLAFYHWIALTPSKHYVYNYQIYNLFQV
jgi:hypothetical protein